MLTIVTCTARRRPGYKLMADSIFYSWLDADKPPIEWLLIDEGIWHREYDCRNEVGMAVRGRFPYHVHSPKPTVWRGPHRLVKKDRWDKCNALNTAACYAKYDRLAFFDDQSVVGTNFIRSHIVNFPEPISLAGSYKFWYPNADVFLNLHDEIAIDGKPHEPGDHRAKDQPIAGPCSGNWMHGGNVSFPLESILKCNGWDELMSGAGGLDDSEFSVRITRVTKPFFNPECIVNYLTDNDEVVGDYVGKAAADIHGTEHSESNPTKNKLFPYKAPDGIVHQFTFNHLPIWLLSGHKRGPHPDNDGTFTAVYDPKLECHRTRFKSLGNKFDLRTLRNWVQSGKAFPVPTEPTKDWRDNEELSNM